MFCAAKPKFGRINSDFHFIIVRCLECVCSFGILCKQRKIFHGNSIPTWIRDRPPQRITDHCVDVFKRQTARIITEIKVPHFTGIEDVITCVIIVIRFFISDFIRRKLVAFAGANFFQGNTCDEIRTTFFNIRYQCLNNFPCFCSTSTKNIFYNILYNCCKSFIFNPSKPKVINI